MSTIKIEPGWQVKGIWNEACAAGPPMCPIYAGMERQGGCDYFVVLRITEGVVNGVDLAGVVLQYSGEVRYQPVPEFAQYGTEGACYITEKVTPQQKEVLDTFARQAIHGQVMRKMYGLKYVPMEIKEDANTFYFKMPNGEMKQEPTHGADGTPVRVENVILPFLSNARLAYTPFWEFNDKDYGIHRRYEKCCGMWGNWSFQG